MDELQAKILAYKPTAEVKELLKHTKVLLLVGPTGSGKNTIEQELLKIGKFKPIVTHTNRSPRLNHGVLEQEGNEYHFVSTDQATDMLDNGKFIEAAFTHGNLYATSIEEFKVANSEGKTAVADIDIKGVRKYRQLSDHVVAVFLLPPNFKVLLQRLVSRYGHSHSEKDIKVRLTTALDELNELITADKYYLIVNHDIKETTDKVLKIMSGNVSHNPDPKDLELAKKLIADIKSYQTQSS